MSDSPRPPKRAGAETAARAPRGRTWSTLNAAVERLRDGDGIVAHETPDEKREYEVVTSYERVREIVESNRNFAHEVLIANRPCDLYFDLDRKDDDVDLSEPVAEIATLVSRAIGRIERFREWTCDRPGKASRHVYFPDVRAASPFVVGAFARDLLSRASDLVRAVVDVNVYPANETTHKTLRMPYCRKRSCPEYRFELRGAPNGAFDDDAFRDSLASSFGRDGPLLDWTPPVSSARLEVRADDGAWEPGTRAACEWVARRLGLRLAPGSSTSGRNYVLRTVVRCPAKGAPHARNVAQLVVRWVGRRARVEYKCLDGDCAGTTWYPTGTDAEIPLVLPREREEPRLDDAVPDE